MKARHRTIAGLALTLELIPLLILLPSCLPVPIGDPDALHRPIAVVLAG